MAIIKPENEEVLNMFKKRELRYSERLRSNAGIHLTWTNRRTLFWVTCLPKARACPIDIAIEIVIGHNCVTKMTISEILSFFEQFIYFI